MSNESKNEETLYDVRNAGWELLNGDGPLTKEEANALAAEIERDNPGTECQVVEHR